MTHQHKELANGRWQQLSFFEQMANIGSEVERAIKWRNKGNSDYSYKAFERSIELIDLTKMDSKNSKRLKELCRLKEILVDSFDKNIYNSSDSSWHSYFHAFNYAARLSC
jgi:hypothetical protein